MANLNVTYDEMNQKASELRQGQQDIESQLALLRQKVADLVQNGFTTTQASGAFDSSYQEFTEGAKRTVQGIDGMAAFLNKAADALQQTDQSLASQLGR